MYLEIMIKIVWLCNVVFTEKKIDQTGSWLQPLAESLSESGSVNLYNISLGNVEVTQTNTFRKIQQWVLPINKSKKSQQIASTFICKEIQLILNEINPDIVHIWGTENIWASVYHQNYIKYITLLDIQGLLFAYAKYYYGGLTFKEILQTIHLKELLMPWRTLWRKKKVFQQRGEKEIKCIKQIKYISYQSNWVKNQVSIINPNAVYFPTKIKLRDNFYKSVPWQYKSPTDNPIIFSFLSAAVSYKGLHVLIKAITVLKRKYPNIQLQLAGMINIGNWLLDGYSAFLNKLITKNNLQNNVVYVGSINEDQIIEKLYECNVCVIPSFIETYCLAFAEAMMVGVPTVVSYAGAMPELAEDKKEALFYNSLDHVDCASKIELLIKNKELSDSISEKARKRRLVENDEIKVLNRQIDIYNFILNSNEI